MPCLRFISLQLTYWSDGKFSMSASKASSSGNLVYNSQPMVSVSSVFLVWGLHFKWHDHLFPVVLSLRFPTCKCSYGCICAHRLAYKVGQFLSAFRFSLLISSFAFFCISFASGQSFGSTSLKVCPYFSVHCELTSLRTNFAFNFSLSCWTRTRFGSGSKTGLAG